MHDVTRRELLQGAIALGGVAAASGVRSLSAPPGFRPFRAPGRIVHVTDERSLGRLGGLPRPEPVRAMVDRVVCTPTGKGAPPDPIRRSTAVARVQLLRTRAR